MNRNAGRIGKVRMKASGFEFRVISGPPDPRNDCGATMIRHARSIAQSPDMSGSVVIGIHKDGSTTVGLRWGDNCIVPRALAPSWIAEVVRRELVTTVTAESVFHEKFNWVD